MRLNLKTKRLIALVLCFTGVGFLLLGKTVTFCTWIGAVLCGGGLLVNFTIRCPHCGRYLNIRGIRIPNFCPRCGGNLHEG